MRAVRSASHADSGREVFFTPMRRDVNCTAFALDFGVPTRGQTLKLCAVRSMSKGRVH